MCFFRIKGMVFRMKLWKRGLLESYVYGFVTGLGVMGFFGLVYLRAVIELPFIGPAHQDYGWVTFVTGTTTLDHDWAASILGYSNFLLAVYLFVIFIGVVLCLAAIKDRKHEQS